MAKKTSRQSIEKRINRSFDSLIAGEYEEALYNIAPVFDVVAKERYPDKKSVGERIKSYILDEQDIIYFLSSQGTHKAIKGVIYAMVDDEHVDQAPKNVKHIKTHAGTLADYIYHNIRCAQSHDAEIDHDIIDLGRNFGIGREGFSGDGGKLPKGKFIVSNATILSLILVVITSPEIKRIKLNGSIKIYNKVSIDKSLLINNKEYLNLKISELFNQVKIIKG